MRKVLVAIAVIAIIIMGQCSSWAADNAVNGKLTTPPAINLPAGGKVVTEINFSDNDVLGIVKKVIPATVETLKSVVETKGSMQVAQHVNPQIQKAADIAKQIDIQGLMDAIQGIQNVRVLVARYPKSTEPVSFINDFNTGVAKLGEFSKIVSNVDEYKGAIAIYAQPDNVGYVGVVFDISSHTAYAARVVGFIDLPKLIQWAGSVAKAVIPAFTMEQPSPSAPAIAPGSVENQ
jgi:hypothetical protein